MIGSRASGAPLGALVLAGVVAVGCASAPTPSHEARPPHWNRPAEDLTTLTLDPTVVRFIRTPGDVPAELAIGGIFVRNAAGGRVRDALGLVVVVDGEAASRIANEEALLHLELDHHVFDGPATPRGVLRSTDGRASFLVEVDRSMVETLIEARTVRGRIGSTVAFVLPAGNRAAFREFLALLPSDAFATTRASRR